MPLFSAPTWSSLRTIGDSLPAKASILMPFVGYFILFQADFIRIISEWSPIFDSTNHNATLHVGLRFYFLYFGLFIFGVGSLLFALFCADVIKRHSNATAFCSYTLPMCSPSDFVEYSIYVQTHTSIESAEYKKAASLQNMIESGITSITQENKIYLLKEYYTIIDIRFPGLRFTTIVCFVAGMTLMALPSLMIFWKVLGMFASQFAAA